MGTKGWGCLDYEAVRKWGGLEWRGLRKPGKGELVGITESKETEKGREINK